MKTPVIYDIINHGDREERVVNQEATMAAREKHKLIKERFRSWVFSDPDRTERLVRMYNDTYNSRHEVAPDERLQVSPCNPGLCPCQSPVRASAR